VQEGCRRRQTGDERSSSAASRGRPRLGCEDDVSPFARQALWEAAAKEWLLHLAKQQRVVRCSWRHVRPVRGLGSEPGHGRAVQRLQVGRVVGEGAGEEVRAGKQGSGVLEVAGDDGPVLMCHCVPTHPQAGCGASRAPTWAMQPAPKRLARPTTTSWKTITPVAI
jgi:hypothetical protein